MKLIKNIVSKELEYIISINSNYKQYVGIVE